MPIYNPFNLTHKFVLILMTLALILLPMTIFAQDPEENGFKPYTSPDGSISFEYPESWTIHLDDLEPFIILSNSGGEFYFDFEDEDSLAVLIVPPSGFVEAFPDIEELPRTPRDLLEFFILDTGEDDIFTEIEEGTLNGHRAVFANFSDNDLYGQIFVLDLDDGDLIMVLGIMGSDNYAQYQETVLSVVASLTLNRYLPDDFRIVTSPDLNLMFEMPADYVYDDLDEEGAIFFASDQDLLDSGPGGEGTLTGLIATEAYYIDKFGIKEGDFQTPEHALVVVSEELVLQNLSNGTISDIEIIELDDVDIDELFQLTFDSDNLDGIVLAFEMPDKRIVTVVAGVNSGELPDFEDIILQIATSVKSLDDNTARADG